MGQVWSYIWRGPPGLPEALSAEWQLVPARWLAIAVVLLGLPWLPLSEGQHTNVLLILGFGAVFNLAVQRALHRRRGLLAFGYLTAIGDTMLSLAMVELAGGFASPFSTVFFVVGVSIAMRSSPGPALAMTGLVIAADSLDRTTGLGGVAIRSTFLGLCVCFASYLRARAQRESMHKTAILEQMAEAVLGEPSETEHTRFRPIWKTSRVCCRRPPGPHWTAARRSNGCCCSPAPPRSRTISGSTCAASHATPHS